MLAHSTHLTFGMRPLLNWAKSQVHAVWQFRLPILSGLFFLSPVLVFDVVLSVVNGRGVDKLVLFALPASIFWLMAVYGLIRNVWVAHLALLPFYVSTIADLYLISNYDMRLTSSTISVMLENSVSASDYVQTLSASTYVAISVMIVFFGLLTYGMRRLRVQSWRCLKIAGVGLALTYTSAAFGDGILAHYEDGTLGVGIEDVLAHDRNGPFGIIPQGYVAYKVYEDAAEHQQKAASFRFGATRRAEPKESEVYVLVIGESSRRDHWSLYGYPRPTTPRIDRTPNIITFRDMVTQEALTQVSVPLMITRRSIDRPRVHLDEKSIVSAFREVGFDAFWLSTQQRNHWTGPLNRYSGEANHVAFFERRFDMVLVDYLRDALNKTTPQDGRQKLFFILHTVGSHFVYKDRYPEAAAPFEPAGTKKEKIVAEYDNSIEYMDRVLSELISTLTQYRGLTALLYVSDHGENLYDDSRMLLGHFFENEYDIPIPAFLWLSPSYTAKHTEVVEAAKRNAVRPLSTKVVFSTLAQMAGIEIPGMDIGKLSVFSDNLQPGPRFFYKQEEILDYDKWVRSSRHEAQADQQQSSE